MKRDLIVIVGLFVLSVGLLWYTAHKDRKNGTKARETSMSQLIVGVNAEYPPFAFMQNNEVVGLDIDLLRVIARELNRELIIKNMSFSALLPELHTGSIQIIASGVTPAEERAKRVLFSEPYLSEDQLVIVTHKDTDAITGIDDLFNKRVVVNEGFSADRFMSSLEGPELIKLETVNQAFMELNNKAVDAFVSALTPLQGYFKKFGKDAFAIIPIENTQEVYAFGVSKKHPELVKMIDKVLQNLRESGELQTIIQAWIPTETV